LGLSGAALVAYAAVTHLVYRTVFTFVNVPYIALSAQMTSDSMVRGQIAGTRMIFAILCGIMLSALTLPLVKSFGGGVEGFFKLSLIYSVLAAAVLFLCFVSTSEAQSTTDDRHPSLGEMFDSVRRNRAFLLLLGATVLGAVAFTMSNKALVYYMKYVVGSEAAVTKGLLATLVTAAVAMVPWIMVTKRTSKRAVWMSGAAITSLALILIYVLRPEEGPTLWTLVALTGVGNAAFILTFWSMLPDTVEFGEWKTGTRAEGAIMGLTLFSQKIALGVGTGMIGILLDVVGYVPNRAQNSETLHGMLLLYTLVPTALFVGAATIIAFYPLDRRTHERIVRVVERKRHRGPTNSSFRSVIER
jgi:GPH family glycoside/pentoside/hexuronide:cation symporter